MIFDIKDLEIRDWTDWNLWSRIGVERIDWSEGHLGEDYYIELKFKGGSDKDIAETLYNHMPVFTTMWLIGDISVDVENSLGQSKTIRFSRVED